ncbi:MAG: DUF2764 family protein [Candidatus Omnitrophota bacterium]
MAQKYYYLTATLPYLSFGQEAALSRKDFLSECEKWLSPRDLRALVSADAHCYNDGCGDVPVLSEWKEFDMEIRRASARVRAAIKKKEEYKVPEILKAVMAAPDPLEMELELEKIRWNFIEDKIPLYFFDLNRLILYYLQLQILIRMSRFNKDKGEIQFYKMCEVKYEKAVG